MTKTTATKTNLARQRTTTPRIALLFTALLAVLLPLGAARQASAHASLDGSTPADGAVLTEAPEEIILRFNEDVTPLGSSTLNGPTEITVKAKQTATGNVTFTPNRRLEDGAWFLSWRVVSADGHPIGGVIRFTVGTGTSTEHALTPRPETSSMTDTVASGTGTNGVDWQDRVLETLTWLGVITGAAGHIARRRSPRQLGAAIALLAAGLRLIEMLDTYRGSAWEIGETRSAVAMLLAGAVLMIPSGAAGLTGLVAVGLSATQSGHPLRLEPGWLYTGAHALHLASAFLWAAAVAATILAPAAARHASRLATIAVAVLLPAGTLNAIVLLDGGDTGARWDRLMLTKLLLVAGALALGAISHFALSRAYRNENRVSTTGTSRGLRVRSITELLIIAAIAIVSAAMTTTTPSRFLLEGSEERIPQVTETTTEQPDVTTTTAMTTATGATLEILFEDGNRGNLHITGVDGITPGAAVTMHLGIVDADGGALEVDQVEYSFVDENGGTGTNGMMTTGSVNQTETVIPGPGTWRIIFTVTSGFSETIGEASITVDGKP